MIRGVIFDMDGLMTDTERLFIQFWCQIMVERGYPEHRDVVTHCIGLNHGATRDYVRQTLGDDFDYQSVILEVAKRSTVLCETQGVPVKPGLYALLDYLDSHQIPYAVATSTVRKNAIWRLENIGVLDRLQGLVTGDMVTVGKPEPEIFLRAAETLNLPAEQCLVLEDSPHGILAAHRAGCLPVMVPDLKQPEEDTVNLLFARCGSLLEVPALIDRVNGTLDT